MFTKTDAVDSNEDDEVGGYRDPPARLVEPERDRGRQSPEQGSV